MWVMWQSHGMAKMADLRDTFALREAPDKINSQIKYKPYDNVVQPSVRALDGDGTTVYRAVQMVIRVCSALVRLLYNGYRQPYNTVMARSPTKKEYRFCAWQSGTAWWSQAWPSSIIHLYSQGVLGYPVIIGYMAASVALARKCELVTAFGCHRASLFRARCMSLCLYFGFYCFLCLDHSQVIHGHCIFPPGIRHECSYLLPAYCSSLEVASRNYRDYA